MRRPLPRFLPLALLITGLVAGLGAEAQTPPPVLTSQQLMPLVLPKACKARETVMAHPTLPAYVIDDQIRKAVEQAKAQFKNPRDTLEQLRALEAQLGPLQEIPSMELHQLLGALAGMDGQPQIQQYHRAFAVALMACLSRTGDGLTPQTAYKVALLSEEYSWFFMNQPVLTKVSRVAKTLDGRRYDIWTVKYADGREGSLYFDVQRMTDSMLRDVKASAAAQAASAASDASR
jgi:hypothetical protein